MIGFYKNGMELEPFPPRIAQSARFCRNDDPNPLRRALVDRLKALGLHRSLVPWLIRNLAAACRIDPNLNLTQFNRRLHYLGWRDLRLDYHTWQLALACLDNEEDRPTIQ
jgi:hypothetical protein